MDATAPGRLSRRWWTLRTGSLVALVLAAVLAQGCSDNNGRVTPSSATTFGDALGGPAGALVVQVTVNPGNIDRGRRGSIVVIVTNGNGIAMPGRNVQLTSSLGRIDGASGQTDANGLYTTTIFIPCEVPTATLGNVTAFVEGKISTPAPFTAITSLTEDPCA